MTGSEIEIVAGRTCPRCSAALPAEDLFCEECGACLNSSAASGPVCPKCSAGPDQIDEEGFCTGCGVRREARGRDHIEIAISAELAGVSDRGLRHHRNEDYLAISLAGAEAAATVDALNPRAVLIVCDGVSSSRDADIASQVATECVRDLLIGAAEQRAICAAITSAQAAVAAIPFQGGSDQDRAATTIVVAVAAAGHITIGWLGDSRAYWIDDVEARQLTRDDSWRNDVVEAGEMSAAEADQSRNAHAITRWLGAGAPEDIAPSTVEFEIPGPGRLLLCTDGLWNYAAEPAGMFALVNALPGDAIDVARGLVDFAKSRGGHDNITAALLTVPGTKGAPPSTDDSI